MEEKKEVTKRWRVQAKATITLGDSSCVFNKDAIVHFTDEMAEECRKAGLRLQPVT
jgi:hypothetical protein